MACHNGRYVHTSWANKQLEYYKSMGLRATGQVWMALQGNPFDMACGMWHVACGMWHVAWDIWDHQNKWTHKEEILRKYQNMESFDCMIQIEHTRQPPDPCPPHYRQLFVRCNLRATLSLSNKLPLKRAAHYGGKRPTCLFLADSKLKRSINNNRTSISGWRPS